MSNNASMPPWAAVGKVVRVKPYGATRVVVAHYASIRGGVRLDLPVAGFVSWNVEELEPVAVEGPFR